MGNRWTLNDEHLNVDKYLRACANLYGHVTPRQFLKLYNRYNTQKIKKEKYLLWMEKLQNHSYAYYTLYTNAIVSSGVSNSKMDEIIYYQEGKKYYDPTKEELLLYKNPNNFEETEQTQEMRDFLLNHIKINKLAVEGLLSKLIWCIRTEEPLQAQMELFNSYGIVFKNMNQANEYYLRLQNLNNNTRKWANCGYTPKELFEMG